MVGLVTVHLDVVDPDALDVSDHHAAIIGYAVLALARATRDVPGAAPTMTVTAGEHGEARAVVTDRSLDPKHLAGLSIEQSPIAGSEIRLSPLSPLRGTLW